MGRRLILGTEPEVDPLKEISQQSMTVSGGVDLQWEDRSVRSSFGRDIFFLFISTIILAAFPWVLSIISIGCLLVLVLIPKLRPSREVLALESSEWTRVPESDISCEVNKDYNIIECKTPYGSRKIVGMELPLAGPLLVGTVSALVRAIDSSQGFCLSVIIKPEEPNSLVEAERLSSRIDDYLNYLSSGGLNAYMTRRGGIWSVRVSILGHSHTLAQAKSFESSIRAVIPDSNWSDLKPKDLSSRILRMNMSPRLPSFYAAGTELSEWLIQIPSELASEIGSNVPGEFIAPIKARAGEYLIGRVINPETLQLGPTIGLSHEDIHSGLLICGGTLRERRHTMSLIVKQLLQSGKRVVIVSNERDATNFASLSEGAVSFELGKDLVLNPMDAEGLPRHIYVSKLMTALEVIAGTDLRSAADLELALSRAIALGNTTVADVQLSQAPDVASTYSEAEEPNAQKPSNRSIAGYEAIRSLHQGSAARSFYGSQTIAMRDLVQAPLSVLIVSQGYLPMEKFAFDLLCIKLSGLQADPNSVVILENAENMRIRNRRYMKRDSWSEMMLRDLMQRGPTIVTLDHPVDMAPGAIGKLNSCVTHRLREGPDIKTAVELLGISVVSSGIHSKARQSSRETSYLRVMPEGVVLLVRNQGETCVPVQLDESITLTALRPEELDRRASKIIPHESIIGGIAYGDSIIDRVAGGQRDTAIKMLRLLERYEPLTEESMRKFLLSGDESGDPDISGVIARLEHAGMILRGHEVHGAVSYTNYRITMKGSMALRQFAQRDEAVK
ncbi:MAG: hypothetical protein ACFFEA_08520 [Candidatus Thorarchaeota archaeon]